MLRLTAVVAIGLLSVGAVPLAAADGIVVVQKRTVSGGQPTIERVWLDRDHLRMESKAGPAGAVIMIADMRQQVIWSVVEERRLYTEMTKADIDALAASLRARGMPSAPKSVFRKAGVGRVGAWTCDVYEVTRDGQRSGELCTVDPGVLRVTVADLQVLKSLAALMPDMAPYANEGFLVPGSATSGYAGIPIREVSMYSSGSQETKELVEVSRQAIPESMFQVPSGYTKTAGRPRQ